MQSRALCKATWLDNPANEKFKNLDSKAQEKGFKESGYWQNADKKVNFGFLFVGSRTNHKISQGLEARVRQSACRCCTCFRLLLSDNNWLIYVSSQNWGRIAERHNQRQHKLSVAERNVTLLQRQVFLDVEVHQIFARRFHFNPVILSSPI